MSNIEKIRQEIERLMKETEDSQFDKGKRYGLKTVLEFIDSLPEETCKDSLQVHETCKENTDSFTSLEEAAEEYATDTMPFGDETYVDSGAYHGFIAGAGWMRKKDVEDMYMSDNRHFLKCYDQGKVDMKVEMMKEAVDGEIVKDISNKLAVTAKNVNLDGFKFGDNVKIVIVKQDDRPRDWQVGGRTRYLYR